MSNTIIKASRLSQLIYETVAAHIKKTLQEGDQQNNGERQNKLKFLFGKKTDSGIEVVAMDKRGNIYVPKIPMPYEIMEQGETKATKWIADVTKDIRAK